MPLRFPIQQWDTGKNVGRRERVRPLSLDLNCFWRKEWVLIIEEKHFVCFPSSEPLSAVQRLVLLACTRTCVRFCLFPLFFCLNQPPCQKMSQQMKCSFLQENRFVAFSSIFVELQKLWFSVEGIFLRDVFFFNIVTIVEFCLKNLLSEKHWSKRVEVQLFKVSGILCVCASEGTSRVSAFLSSGAIIDKLVQHWVYTESQWRFNSIIAPLVCSYIRAVLKGSFF